MPPAISPESPALLEMHAIHKRFPGVRALDGANLSIRPGEVHALMGENGAGKSTLMKILAGAQPPDDGEIVLEGERVRFSSPRDALAAGVSMIYQDLSLLPNLTVAENIVLAQEPTSRFGAPDRAQERAIAQRALAPLGISFDVGTLVSDLTRGQQQLVEIARSLHHRSKLIVMDEPTAALTLTEAGELFAVIRRLKADGIAFVYVSHRLNEVYAISDRITVLRDGRYVGTRDAALLPRDELVRQMAGGSDDEPGATLGSTPSGDEPSPVMGAVALEVRALGQGERLLDIDLVVREGEVVVLAGLVGSGRTELVRCLVGADRFDEGEVRVAGEPVAFRSPRDAIAHRVAFVPEERRTQGLVITETVERNITLARLPSLRGRGGFVSDRACERLAQDFIERLKIKTPSPKQLVSTLSGGNQQKVVLARWLAMEPAILILDEPTAGVDVNTKGEFHELIRDLAREGMAVLVVSSDIEEVLTLADRVVVMHEGSIRGELSRAEANEERILTYATGSDAR
jgi:ABC-type sugar transport system ATPase subunit